MKMMQLYHSIYSLYQTLLNRMFSVFKQHLNEIIDKKQAEEIDCMILIEFIEKNLNF